MERLVEPTLIVDKATKDYISTLIRLLTSNLITLENKDKELLAAIGSGGGSGGVTDHGALTGLADDDHTQYLNNTRGDARYSQLGHGHIISDVSGLQTSLDSKADISKGVTTTTVILNTGSTAISRFSTNLTDAGISPTSKVNVWLNAVGVTGNQADNVEMDNFSLTAIPKSGILTIVLETFKNKFLGNYSLSYRY